jgi:peroxiredoxin
MANNNTKKCVSLKITGVDFYDFYDFYNFYDHNSKAIPVLAVFIIDKNGTVVFAKSENGDYRLRVEPQDILDALSKITI